MLANARAVLLMTQETYVVSFGVVVRHGTAVLEDRQEGCDVVTKGPLH